MPQKIKTKSRPLERRLNLHGAWGFSGDPEVVALAGPLPFSPVLGSTLTLRGLRSQCVDPRSPGSVQRAQALWPRSGPRSRCIQPSAVPSLPSWGQHSCPGTWGEDSGQLGGCCLDVLLPPGRSSELCRRQLQSLLHLLFVVCSRCPGDVPVREPMLLHRRGVSASWTIPC